MSLLTQVELRRLEETYAVGIGSAAVVELFRRKGERFSEATLRKYVQLGLLPTSQRVGTRGRHRGSSGLYPVAVVRLVNEIKAALTSGATLEEIRFGHVGLVGEVQGLRRTATQILSRFEEAVVRDKQRQDRAVLRRLLTKHRRALDAEVRALDRLAQQIGGRTNSRRTGRDRGAAA